MQTESFLQSVIKDFPCKSFCVLDSGKDYVENDDMKGCGIIPLSRS